MTNPFAPAPTETAAPAVDTTKTEAAPNLGIGDPFASPVGVGDGERITDFVDRLLLVKPTEYIREMNTSQGKTDAVRVDIAVLDDETEPTGKVIVGVLLFQQALKREAKGVLDNPATPMLLGRLNKGKTGGGNTLYTFQAASEAEADIARSFIKKFPKAL